MFRLLFLAAAVLPSLLGNDLAGVALDSALNSPQELGQLFDAFAQNYGRDYNLVEKASRKKVFREHLQQIQDHNNQDTSWREAVNQFADMTSAERAGHLGLNLTNMGQPTERVSRRDNLETPDSVSWIGAGAVTTVKNQGSCGSCWIFSALGSLEGIYKQHTGVLRSFSEQQVLSCDEDSNGCSGGLMWNAISYVQSEGRLASSADYPYTASWNTCENKGNAMVGARITGYVHVEEGEEHTIAAMSERALVVTIYVADSFFSYSSGIYRDEYRPSRGNHALVGVGYTPEYVLVKNSWGSDWGEEGFIKIARNYDGCAFHQAVGYATVEVIADDHNDSDEATDYNPEDGDDGDDGDCVDTFTGCLEPRCKYTLVYQQCQKTCGACEECPSGTVMCDDGVCRHEHMC